jgi:hypothetical protein
MEGLKETTKELSQITRYLGGALRPEPTECKAVVMNTQL